MTDRCHPSHQTRSSDSSFYDEVCVNCGATNIAGGGWGRLSEPCLENKITTMMYPKLSRADAEFVEIVRAATVLGDGRTAHIKAFKRLVSIIGKLAN